MRCW